jgi:hypothetical protein
MKIKVAIANYESNQIQYLNRIIDEFKSFKKYTTDIIVYTTVPVNANYVLFDTRIGTALPFACRTDMANAINDYDLFIYAENDMLITEDNIDALLEYTQQLSEDQLCGYIRYEWRDGNKILLDPNPHREPSLIHERYDNGFSIKNEHQGCWVLTKSQLKKAIESGGFMVNPHDGGINPKNGLYMGMLEQGASDPYTDCKMVRMFPYDLKLLERLLICHLPTKYSTMDIWVSHGITIDKLQNY